MKKAFAVLLLTSLAFFNPKQLIAQDYSSLFSSFDAASLTTADKRFLQAALAFEGYYNGLLDGDWGPRSRDAMQRYSLSEFGTSSEEWHMAFLASTFFDEWTDNGWVVEYIPSLGMSFLTPERAKINQPPSKNFVNWRHSNSTLAYSIGIHDRSTAQSLHDYTSNWHDSTKPLYAVRKSNFAVTAAKKSDGSILYTRSNLVRGNWSTIMLSAKPWDEPTLNAVAASITVGRSPQVIFTEGGRLEQAIRQTAALLEGDKSTEPPQHDAEVSAEVAEPSEANSSASSGTGFFVSEQGYVLTNAHVVDGCSRVTVDEAPATVIEKDSDFDLALLKTEMAANKSIASFSAAPARLNSDVTVVGYPYAGLLGGLNVTRGSVSSLKGLGGNPTTMQITAPVQMGNSGGPLVGNSGEIVGVIVSKIDALKFADATGDLPQSVNYAIRGEIAKLFLSQNGVNPSLILSQDPIEPTELATKAESYTVYIECD